MKIKTIEVKKEEELEKKVLAVFECSLEEVILNKKEEKKSLFNKKQEYDVITIEEVKNYIKEELLTLSKLMNIPFSVEIRVQNKVFKIVLDSEQNALLIGKQGKNLNAMLTILKQKLRNELNLYLKINMDIGNYKETNNKKLEILAKKLAKEVLETGIEIKMDSMNSYQRRIVHNILNSFKGIETGSIGEEPNRCVIIKREE